MEQLASLYLRMCLANFFQSQLEMVHNKSPTLTFNKFLFTSKLSLNISGKSYQRNIECHAHAFFLVYHSKYGPLLLNTIQFRSKLNYHSAQNQINFGFDKLEVLQEKFAISGVS